MYVLAHTVQSRIRLAMARIEHCMVHGEAPAGEAIRVAKCPPACHHLSAMPRKLILSIIWIVHGCVLFVPLNCDKPFG